MLEKWSMARADQILTPNIAFKRIFAARSCPEEKIAVVMNSPDGSIFPLACVLAPSAESEPPAAVYCDVSRHIGRTKWVGCCRSSLRAHSRQAAHRTIAHLRQSNSFPGKNHAINAGTRFAAKVLHLGEKPLEQIVEAIDVCDVGVVPNRRNAFTDFNMPTRIFEYLARGKPVIAPRTAGIQDYFDKHSLLFFEPGDAEDLAQTVQFVACHPEGLTQSLNEVSKSTKRTPGNRKAIPLCGWCKNFWSPNRKPFDHFEIRLAAPDRFLSLFSVAERSFAQWN